MLDIRYFSGLGVPVKLIGGKVNEKAGSVPRNTGSKPPLAKEGANRDRSRNSLSVRQKLCAVPALHAAACPAFQS
jgi:hypothetical protein